MEEKTTTLRLLSKREALLVVTALGCLQNRIGQRTSWLQRKRLTTLRARLADLVTIGEGEGEAATAIRRALKNAHRGIAKRVAVGEEINALRKLIKEAANIDDTRLFANINTEEDNGEQGQD